MDLTTIDHQCGKATIIPRDKISTVIANFKRCIFGKKIKLRDASVIHVEVKVFDVSTFYMNHCVR